LCKYSVQLLMCKVLHTLMYASLLINKAVYSVIIFKLGNTSSQVQIKVLLLNIITMWDGQKQTHHNPSRKGLHLESLLPLMSLPVLFLKLSKTRSWDLLFTPLKIALIKPLQLSKYHMSSNQLYVLLNDASKRLHVIYNNN